MLIPSNRTKRECILSRLCFLVLSVWVSLPSAAQNNPYTVSYTHLTKALSLASPFRTVFRTAVIDAVFALAGSWLMLADEIFSTASYVFPCLLYTSKHTTERIVMVRLLYRAALVDDYPVITLMVFQVVMILAVTQSNITPVSYTHLPTMRMTTWADCNQSPCTEVPPTS